MFRGFSPSRIFRTSFPATSTRWFSAALAAHAPCENIRQANRKAVRRNHFRVGVKGPSLDLSGIRIFIDSATPGIQIYLIFHAPVPGCAACNEFNTARSDHRKVLSSHRKKRLVMKGSFALISAPVQCNPGLAVEALFVFPRLTKSCASGNPD
jgi:hypothetical protein